MYEIGDEDMAHSTLPTSSIQSQTSPSVLPTPTSRRRCVVSRSKFCRGKVENLLIYGRWYTKSLIEHLWFSKNRKRTSRIRDWIEMTYRIFCILYLISKLTYINKHWITSRPLFKYFLHIWNYKKTNVKFLTVINHYVYLI